MIKDILWKLTRKIKKDGSKYFGPYTDSRRLRTILKVIHKVFPIRSCSYFIDGQIIEQKRISICLDYHIKRCQGPCEGLVTEKEYKEWLKKAKIEFAKQDFENNIKIAKTIKESN